METTHPTIPHDTCQVLVVEDGGKHIRDCCSRSLIFDRMANPALKELRKRFFENHLARVDGKSLPMLRNRRLEFLSSRVGVDAMLFAELKARLLLNASGGVMENAGLCLDRFSNLPYIPGSAVKGCARRAAIYFLHEWTEGGTKPEQLTDDLAYANREDLFRDIVLIFGWVESDWKQEDFCWAWGGKDAWFDMRNELAERLLVQLGRNVAEKPEPWKQLPAFGGLCGFLSAWPKTSPKKDIELDVVTCHHPNYYKDEPGYETAQDTESPIPVVFPAVARDHVFAFGVHPIRRKLEKVDADALTAKARAWLKLGLTLFGIGGKTAAGYGWFEIIDPERALVGIPAAHTPPSDYTEASFKNAVLNRLDRRGEWNTLRKEIAKLLKPENASWLKRFKEATQDREYKDLRKQEWYPK